MATAVSLSCTPKSRFLPNLSCFEGEKIRVEPVAFGALTRDPSTPDGWSGLEVYFGVDAEGKLSAAIREKGGPSKETRPVERVSYNSASDSISFTYIGPGGTKFTRTYRPSCGRLVGYATYFRSAEDPSLTVEDTLPRIER